MSTKKQLNIQLPSELQKIIEEEIDEGAFTTKAEFIRHLLRKRGTNQ